jgi:hypothetical protein
VVRLKVGCDQRADHALHATLAMANSSGSTPLVRAAAAPLDPLVVVQDAVGILDARALKEQLRPDASR